jgi:AAA domain
MTQTFKFAPDDNGEEDGGVAHDLGEWNAGLDVEPPPPRGWLLGNSFCRCFISSLFADGGVGKTALRTLQALALAIGRPLTDEHVFQRARVLLISLEDDDKELRRRVRAARIHHNIALDEVNDWLFLAAPSAKIGKLMTLNPKTGTASVGTMTACIEEAIRRHDIGLVILDPLVKTHSIPENANTEMDMLAQLLTDMATKHNIAIDAPHHVSKGMPDPGNPDRGRGASATKDAGRLIYTLTPMSADEAELFGINEHERHSYVRLDRAKVNIIRKGAPAKWFKLVNVGLGNATELYPNGDEVQTVEPWSPPDAWEGLSNELLNRILTAIDAGTGDGNYYTVSNSKTERAAWQVVERHAPDKTKGQAQQIIATWLKTGVLEKFDYENPKTRKPVIGLRVISTKRPGATT